MRLENNKEKALLRFKAFLINLIKFQALLIYQEAANGRSVFNQHKDLNY